MATAPTAPPIAAPLDVAKMVGAYVAIRDRRTEITKAFEAEDDELKAKLRTLEGALLGHLSTHGMDSVKTSHGTVYKQEEVKPNITDDAAFYDFVKTADAVEEALERRCKKSFVVDFMANHDGLPPPGISVSREYVVRVRRAS
jgi:hypothetical protein